MMLNAICRFAERWATNCVMWLLIFARMRDLQTAEETYTFILLLCTLGRRTPFHNPHGTGDFNMLSNLLVSFTRRTLNTRSQLIPHIFANTGSHRISILKRR